MFFVCCGAWKLSITRQTEGYGDIIIILRLKTLQGVHWHWCWRRWQRNWNMRACVWKQVLRYWRVPWGGGGNDLIGYTSWCWTRLMARRYWRQWLASSDLKLVLNPLMTNSYFLLRESLITNPADWFIETKLLMRRNLKLSCIDLNISKYGWMGHSTQLCSFYLPGFSWDSDSSHAQFFPYLK